MFTRIYGKVVFVCDRCDSDFETNCVSYELAKSHLRNEGWRSVGKEIHYCPGCVKQ
jgi:hypothetical protein